MHNTNNTRFAIYARISKDREGAGLGVARQIEDCEEYVRNAGGLLAATYQDNDISAYGGKERPGYRSMLEAVKNGEIDSIVVWHSDRLTRNMTELEEYGTITRSIPTYTVRAGPIDFTTATGRLIATQLGAVNRYHVDHAIEQISRKKLQAARAGLPSGGNRAYGYEQNGMDIIEHEAAVVREVIERFIGGDSWRSIAEDLNRRSIPTAKGNRWSAINVHNVAVRPRNIGIRVHNKDEYKAAWEPLISMDKWEDLHLAIKRGQALHGSRTYTRKHLLKGFVFCGQCGNRMNIINAQNRDGSYSPAFSCRKFDDRRGEVGCGGVKRRKAPVEELVIECLMYRLDTPVLGELLEGSKTATPKLKQLLRDQDVQQQRVQEILSLYSTGEMDFNEYKSAKTMATARLEALHREIDSASSKSAIANVPVGQTLREAWDNADLMWRRQLVDTVIDKIYIDPKRPGQGMKRWKNYQFDPELVRIIWKV
jgi:DNA invertase Pin-like site-specific DNA recombinase